MKWKAAAVCAGVLALPIALIAPGHATKEQKKTFSGRNYAHRGLHTEDRSIPENSIKAFRLAAENGYGIELDVRLTKDGQVVVFHDDDLKRVCGAEKRVDELTFEELQQLRLYGTEEKIPLFTEVLKTVDAKVPLIVEVKPGKKNRELCRKTEAILSAYSGDACIESFDPFIVGWFRIHAKGRVRGQLAMPKKEYKLSKIQNFALGYGLFNVIGRPQFMAYKIGPRPLSVRLSERLGAMAIGWTSHDRKNEKGRDGVIFEYYTPNVRF